MGYFLSILQIMNIGKFIVNNTTEKEKKIMDFCMRCSDHPGSDACKECNVFHEFYKKRDMYIGGVGKDRPYCSAASAASIKEVLFDNKPHKKQQANDSNFLVGISILVILGIFILLVFLKTQ